MKNIQLDITKSNSVPSEADAIAAYEPSESHYRKRWKTALVRVTTF